MKELTIDGIVFGGFGQARKLMMVQRKYIAEHFADFKNYRAGTINIFSEKALVFNSPTIKTPWLKWHKNYAEEMFLFVPCKLICDNQEYEAMVYMPSNSPHASSTRKWEIICKRNVINLTVGCKIQLVFDNPIANEEWGCLI